MDDALLQLAQSLAAEKSLDSPQLLGRGVGDGGRSTHDLLVSISDQVKRVLDSPAGYDASISAIQAATNSGLLGVTFPGSAEKENEGRRQDLAPLRQQQQQGKVTPFELWRKTHGVMQEDDGGSENGDRDGQDSLAEIASNGEGVDWDNLVARLYKSSEQKEENVKRERERQNAKEQAELSFKPKINAKSQNMTGERAKIADRAKLIEERRKQKIAQAQKHFLEKELAEATFKPKTNVSNGGAYSVIESRVRQPQTPARNNSTTPTQTPTKRDHEDEKELTFKPSINLKSAEMVSGRRNRMRTLAAPRPNKVTNTNTDAEHEQETFRPKINSRSRSLVIQKEKGQPSTRSLPDNNNNNNNNNDESQSSNGSNVQTRSDRGNEIEKPHIPAYERLYHLAQSKSRKRRQAQQQQHLHQGGENGDDDELSENLDDSEVDSEDRLLTGSQSQIPAATQIGPVDGARVNVLPFNTQTAFLVGIAERYAS